jgi:transposase
VRRERQRQAKARRPKGVRRSGQHAAWRPELYRARHRLLKARERLGERERRRPSELFERDPIIAEARGLKERFRDVYRAGDRSEAERRLELFLAAVDRAGLPAFDAFAKGIRLRREELLAHFDEPTTNGYAEGVTNKVKVIKRRAYGIPTFTAFRQRVLLACGNRITRPHPARSTRTQFSTGLDIIAHVPAARQERGGGQADNSSDPRAERRSAESRGNGSECR